MSLLIQPLSDGPVDIVGDVHGEIDALRDLLGHLGYDDAGHHQAGRQLVFLGDLVNRGPDSPSVIELVMNLVQSRRAQCLLGNHELNLLIGNRTASSNWFYGEPRLDENGQVIPQRLADDSQRHVMRGWLRSLPLALFRTDLRIIHACWNAEMIELAQGQVDVVQLCELWRERIDSELIDCEEDVQRQLEHQNRNPVTMLTSGPQERLEPPVCEGARVRFTRPIRWWTQYNDHEYCVFGHYSHMDDTFFGGRSCICVDFGVGKRWTERQMGVTGSFAWKLAALRFPEKELVFDDGSRRPCL